MLEKSKVKMGERGEKSRQRGGEGDNVGRTGNKGDEEGTKRGG